MSTRRSFLAICLAALVPWRRVPVILPSSGMVRQETCPGIGICPDTGLSVKTTLQRINDGPWKEVSREPMSRAIAEARVYEWKTYSFPDYLLRTPSISGKSTHTTPVRLPWVRA